jgi:hypothetical protein
MKMKTLIVAAMTTLLMGCATARMEKRVAQMSTADLQLRRYQVMSRLSGPHYFSGRAFDDAGISDDTEEKEAIERELARRGALDYRTAPHVTYW